MSFFFVDDLMRPSRILDQQFGVALNNEDLVSPLIYPFSNMSLMRNRPVYLRHWSPTRNDFGSTIKMDKDKYQVMLDVQHFAPDEITVKANGNNVITIEGNHKEKQDQHGFVSRNFVRKYILPEGYDINNVESVLSSDGVLCIACPKINVSDDKERCISIQQTGAPIKAEEKIEGETSGQKE